MENIKIRVINENKEFVANKEENLLKSLINAGVNIYADCGGKGICGRCKIKIIKGNYSTQTSYLITKEEEKEKIVLACTTYPLEDLIIEIPKEFQFENKEISTYFETEKENLEKVLEKMKLDTNALIKKVNFKLPPPTIETSFSDADRLLTFLTRQKNMIVIIDDLDFLNKLPVYLRKNNWEGSVLISEKYYNDNTIFEVCDLLDNDQKFYALAIDIGTTTVAMSLIDIETLNNVITKTTFNKQMVYGEDIITRIIYSEKEEGLKQLHYKIIATLNELISEIIQSIKICQRDIYAVVISGNTTMIHFLFNILASYIRREPYTPVATKFPIIDAKNLNLMINSNAKVYSIPLVASYIGGDIVAGVVACGIDVSDEICVLIDLGTNGEIVVGNREFLVSAACSCGPAFEGVGISCGVRAVEGAIEDVKIIDGEVRYVTIGNKRPTGICGSGLIDIPAELLKAGIIDMSGRVKQDIKNPHLIDRIRKNELGEYEFIIEKKEFTDIGRDIVITQSDIQNILRSKGAIFHGLYVLLKSLNLKFSDIKKFFLSGGFGSFLDIKKAQILGLLPDIEEEKFVISGNTSLLGAKLFLVSKQARERMFEVAKKMTYIDLSNFPIYMNEYVSTLFIPHTDFSLFPNVIKYLKEVSK
ncbi:MAG: ASKHA domain-containing protein [Elusimicrobiota bacterium]|nr:ASKHA domain-containing protein [Endomicrobiia bacterium]MDW8165945.1 ASKHA domain-containing protein [Elusimicrobiota bacterium]